MSHGHSHHSDVAVSQHTVRIVYAILIPCMVLTAVGLILLWPSRPKVPASLGDPERHANATVQAITTRACAGTQTDASAAQPCGTAHVAITSGPGAGREVDVDLPRGTGAPSIAVGDKVVLQYNPPVQGVPERFDIIDHQRGLPLTIMLVVCALTIVAFGRLRGFTALIGLVVSFVALLYFIIPGILDGEPPLLVAIVGSSAIMFAVLYLTHGVNVHTSVAIVGTLASLVVTGLLGALFTATTALTGFGTEESLYLSIAQGQVDMRGLLLAGIIIGALGVLDDVTVTQATTVAELANGAKSRLDLFRAATRIGRAHVASAVNTIVLAYAGAALPLLLLISVAGRNAGDLLTSQFLAQEIVRSAVGTIGLVAAVPITTALACLVAEIRRPVPRMQHRHAAPVPYRGY